MYERFRQLLQERGITSYRVSVETGVKQTTLSDWKTGRAVPKAATLQKIAKFFGVSVDWLIGNSECRNADKHVAFPRLTEKLSELGFSDNDTDFLVSVYKAHIEQNS